MDRKFAPKLYRILTLIAAVSLLAACSLPAARPPSPGPASTATLSPEQVQTQINQMLTQLPTVQGQAIATAIATATPTQPLPTLPAEETEEAAETAPPVITATDQPTAVPPTATQVPATAVPPTATATTLPSETPVSAGESGGGVPTVAVTPLNPAATALPPSGPTFTPAPGDPRSRLGAPSSTDPMNDASTWIWPTGSDRYTRGSFGGGQQTVIALTDADGWRMANPLGREFGNLYLEATIRTTACASSDHYGLIFRVPVLHDPDQGYLFGVTCDGRYSLRRWDGRVGTKGEMTWLVNWTFSTAIAAGQNQTNRIGAMMVGSRLLLYANGSLLTEVQDTRFPAGYFGVFIGSDVTDDLTIQVDEMSYWENPTP